MVSTRSKKNGDPAPADADTGAQAGEKRSAPAPASKGGAKKVKKEQGEQKLTGENGELGLRTEEAGEAKQKDGSAKDGEEVQEDKSAVALKEGTPRGSDEEPKHGTLESGHIYFLYRPKVEVEDAQSIDDVSKFHILLIPHSEPYGKGHYHRIIEVGKKKLPDPGAKNQVIWGLVGSVGSDRSALKDAFGAYEYDTKTRGHRHQPAARPAARGHYILHSPRDELADSPNHNRKRDYKTLLAYEITTPPPEDFGRVQEDLGLAPKAAVVLQVKDPNAESRGNPRAAGIPREKRAQYPPSLQNLFQNRRFIPANPPAFLSYTGTELLLISSPHELHDSLGKNGEQVEEDLDHAAQDESVGVDVDAALKELGLNKKEFEEEALEGSWS